MPGKTYYVTDAEGNDYPELAFFLDLCPECMETTNNALNNMEVATDSVLGQLMIKEMWRRCAGSHKPIEIN